MANSARTDPRAIRAARRAAFPTVRARRPRPGRHHPASSAEVRAALEQFGKSNYYGIKSVELVPAPVGSGELLLGKLSSEGRIELYDQPPSPWRLGGRLPARARARLRAAGATIERGVVTWPEGMLKRFMLGYVLAHEVGHHVLQHERRLRGARAARTTDHEARADAIAGRLRKRLE